MMSSMEEKTEVVVCAVCQQKEVEAEPDVKEDNWISCDSCEKWMHQYCVGLQIPPEVKINYKCLLCLKSSAKNSTGSGNQLKSGKDDMQNAQISNPNQDSTQTGNQFEVHKVPSNPGNTWTPIVDNLKNGRAQEQSNPQADVCPDLQARLNELSNAILEIKTSMNNATTSGAIPNQLTDHCRRYANNAPPWGDDQFDSVSQVGSSLSRSNHGYDELITLMKRQQIEALPEFYGDEDTWPLFIAQFEATSREGQFLPHENLRRLRKALKGKAFELVKGKLNHPENVPRILIDLADVFGNQSRTIKKWVIKLRSLPPPQTDNPTSVMTYRVEMSNALAYLKTVNAESYLNSPTITDDIVQRLPGDIRRKWTRYSVERLHRVNGDAKFEEFVQWFMYDTRWVLYEQVDNKTKFKHSQPVRGNAVNVHDERVPETSDSKTHSDKAEVAKCGFCKKSIHAIVDCPGFVKGSVKTRWNYAKKRRLCFICLGKWHKAECPQKKPCEFTNCDRFHHRLLHYESEPEKPANETELSAMMRSSAGEETYFRIVPVKIYGNNGKTIETNAFFDEGSSPTMLSEKLAEELELLGESNPLCLSWTDGRLQTVPGSYRVSIKVSGIEVNADRIHLRDIRTVPVANLDLPVAIHDVKKLQQRFSHLQGIHIPQPFDKKPELLIGLEHPKLALARRYREGGWNEPVATETMLGWVVHGKSKTKVDSEIHRCFVVCECTETKLEPLNKLVEGYFSTEYFGVRAAPNVASLEIERAYKLLKDTTKNVGNRYETGLLWKSDKVVMPNSKPMAIKRLLCLEKKLSTDQQLKEAFQQKIKENLENGFWRKLTSEEANNVGPRTWYLPIFAVKNPHKPNKTRIVYDAAATVNGTSLNSCLLTGPDLLQSIVGVLYRAREGQVAVAGDIKDMFHRVLIRKQDQDSQRILWRNCEQNRDPDVFVVQVMSFGAACSPCSAQWVKNQNALRFIEQKPRAVTCITRNHYVDDMYDSFNSEEEAIQTTLDVIDIHKQGGFEIRNWLSNSKVIMAKLNGVQPDTNAELSLKLDTDNVDKILGFYWNVSKDIFTFRLNIKRVDPGILNKKKVPSKRQVLQIVMSVFDPHGYAAPILVHGKILLQRIWRQELGWDHKLTDSLNMMFLQWFEELKLIEEIAMPRCLSVNLPKADRLEIHCFVDASEEAFAAVCYLRIVCGKQVEVVMIGSKNKVAPKKQLSIPKLELQAAILGVRLEQCVMREMTVKVHGKWFWSDSKTVLAWIRSDHRRYLPFVGNRVSEILDSSRIREWRWIPTSQNVADMATKKPKVIDLTPDGLWMKGPDFLRTSEEQWPEFELTNLESQEELRVNVIQAPVKYDFVDIGRFSRWNRLLRIIGWVLRAKAKMLEGRRQDKLIPIRVSPALSAYELNQAEKLLLRKAQWESFAHDVIKLTDGEAIADDSKIRTLSPFLDNDGLVKMKGRLDAVPHLPIELRRPVIMFREHPLTRMIAQAYHERYRHQGVETVVNEMRQRFWVIGLRVLVKSVVKNCQLCKNKKAIPAVPEMAPLPRERVAVYEDPFTYTGLDFFGPLLVTVGRRTEKRYGALFTCLTTRAVHLELASSLDTNSCIMVVRNFMCRRGPPLELWSDNGTNLHGAEAELRGCLKALDQSQLQSEGQIELPGKTRTQWRFITPRAPHMGGAWERMIQTVKKILYMILKEKQPREEVLRNALIEVESVVNSRPLTYMPVDPDTLEALTPNHILRMSGKIVYPPAEVTEKVHTKPWRQAQSIADQFWKRFVLEYTPDLAKRTKWYADQKPITEGDIVILLDENLPRNLWMKGRVEVLHPGPDGKVRSVTVRVAGKTKKRPVAKLAVLDVRREGNW